MTEITLTVHYLVAIMQIFLRFPHQMSLIKRWKFRPIFWQVIRNRLRDKKLRKAAGNIRQQHVLVVAIIVNYFFASYNLDISIKVAISNFKAQNYGCESDRELIECVFGKSGHRCGAKFHESDKGSNAAMKLCSVHYSKVILNIHSTQ